MPPKKPLPPTYTERLLEELDAMERDYTTVLDDSEIQYVNPNRPDDGFILLVAADWGWGPTRLSARCHPRR
jgi:hypothetical protein